MRSLLLFFCSILPLAAQSYNLPLAGSWDFRLDPDRVGRQQNWAAEQWKADVIYLPGSTDQAGFGTKTSGPEKGWLSRPYTYEGPAWYRKTVVIPDSWRSKRIILFLERPHWQTEVWVDGRPLGMQDSLSTPHRYDLTAALSPGTHRLTLCVDNTYKIDVGRNAHSVTEHTQTNWNGIVGRIELQAGSPVWIESARAYPDAAAHKLRVEAVIGNATGRDVLARLTADAPGVAARPASTSLTASAKPRSITLELPLQPDLKPWDEYEGRVYPLRLTLDSPAGIDEQSAPLPLRTIATRDKQFLLNGRPLFLRGTLECNIFPLTGYPPMTADGWDRLFRIARSYGLNHFRFHSWCPPEAAFEAADRAGFLLHVELPVWSGKVGKDAALNEFMRAEGQRILQTYGNHPSFTMLCLGNELTGDYQFMDDLVAELKASDPRRLYTFTADHRRRQAGPTSDYYVTHHTKEGPVRIHGARFEKNIDGTDHDFAANVAGTPMPLVAHELGQWVTYPNYREIGEYTGVLKPRNLEAFRDRLAARGMIDQADAFQQATGRFAWLLYKEDIEANFRTRGMGGFQLLQLQDFPGQGEALIGLLDSFWHSKGIYTPDEFRRFCNETVALLRFPKFVWTNDETFRGKAEVAHYGKTALSNVSAQWIARDDAGRVWNQGKLPPAALALGDVTSLGEISFPLNEIRRATRLTISLSLDTGIHNDWDVWVYPKDVPENPPAGVLVTGSLAAEARRKLEEGGRVVLLLSGQKTGSQFLPTTFLPVFWSLTWFPKQPGTMGILCDPASPALAAFPTDRHSNWQWWDITEPSQAFILNDTPPGFRPIVQVIDDYHRNHKLGAVFETRVGRGKLLVSTLDLQSRLNQRPAARQLRYSLLQYAASDRFNPSEALSPDLLAKLE